MFDIKTASQFVWFIFPCLTFFSFLAFPHFCVDICFTLSWDQTDGSKMDLCVCVCVCVCERERERKREREGYFFPDFIVYLINLLQCSWYTIFWLHICFYIHYFYLYFSFSVLHWMGWLFCCYENHVVCSNFSCVSPEIIGSHSSVYVCLTII